MIRFRTSQLESLPDRDAVCTIEVPDGRVLSGKFHRHHDNPYIAGPDLVAWIKSWLPYAETHPVVLHQDGNNKLRLELRDAPARPPAPLRAAVRRKAAQAGRERQAGRR